MITITVLIRTVVPTYGTVRGNTSRSFSLVDTVVGTYVGRGSRSQGELYKYLQRYSTVPYSTYRRTGFIKQTTRYLASSDALMVTAASYVGRAIAPYRAVPVQYMYPGAVTGRADNSAYFLRVLYILLPGNCDSVCIV